MFRRACVILMAVVAAAPVAGATTQDELLSDFTLFADSEFFDEHPILFVVRLQAIARLQVGALSTEELSGYESLYHQLSDLKEAADAAEKSDPDELHEGFEALRTLRTNLSGATAGPLGGEYERLLDGADHILGLYQTALESRYPSLSRTTLRITLLADAVEAADLLSDAEGFSRLSRLLEAVRSEYEADMGWAQAAITRAQGRIAIEPLTYLSLDFMTLHSDLIESEKQLLEAHALFSKHAEPERAQEARVLHDEVLARSHGFALRVVVGAGAYILGLWGLALVATARIKEWASVRHQARLGDELAMEV